MNKCKEIMIGDKILDISKVPHQAPDTQKSLNTSNCNCWIVLLLVCILIFQRPNEFYGIHCKLKLRPWMSHSKSNLLLLSAIRPLQLQGPLDSASECCKQLTGSMTVFGKMVKFLPHYRAVSEPFICHPTSST